MTVEIKAYQTSDSKIFSSKHEADEHESYTALIKAETNLKNLFSKYRKDEKTLIDKLLADPSAVNIMATWATLKDFHTNLVTKKNKLQ